MGKMLKRVRLRRYVGSKIAESQKVTSLPVFRITERDFVVNMPNIIDTSPDQHHKNKNENWEPQRGVSKHILQSLEQYCNKTTLHGLRYVGDTSLSVGERIFWLLSFSFAIGFAAYYISNIYEKWNTSPVIISFSPFDAKLTSIPFPAVTICNMNQAKKSEVMKIKSDGNPLELKLLNDVCNGNEEYIITQPYNWSTLRNFLIRVGNSCSDMMKVCEWSSKRKNCDELFNNDLTDEGLCCSFNRLPPKSIFRNPNDISLLNQTYPDNVYDWNPEKGFIDDDNGDENIVPKRPLGAGSHLGLSVVMDAQVDEYYCSSTSSIGFKIILSNPIETPKMAAFGSLLSTGVEVRYSITPSVREASDNLRSISLKKRQCYFSKERRLQYYRSYTQRNCNLECQSNYTYELCLCIPYYLPRNKSIKACGKTDMECLNTAKENLERSYGNGSSCNCLPGCFDLVYGETKSYGKLSADLSNIWIYKNAMNESVKDFNKYFSENMAVGHFFFPNSKFTKQIKSELYGFTEILSNIGGLLGLCMGFSFLSLVEVIYFISLRVLCKLSKNQKATQDLHPEGFRTKYPFTK